uniref:Uncharacterized protein n=1 Tax=Arundo donax TaxID=35708 RepID=A0A0A8YFV4_ARUDO
MSNLFCTSIHIQNLFCSSIHFEIVFFTC